MITYQVSVEEIGIAVISATKEYNKYIGSWHKKSHLENIFFGKIGEIGYSKHSGLPFNFEFYANKGDGGVDIGSAQVKTVTWSKENKTLKVEKGDSSLTNKNVDKFVLMFLDPKLGGTEVNIVGEVSKANFKKKSKPDEKYPKLLILDEKDLDIHY
jgi:hypothetical protein